MPTHAQLITDSKAKLKSQKAKKESDGFLFFGKRKGKSDDTQAKTEKASTPKYSKAAIGKRFRNLRSPAPRYSNVAASGKIAGQSSSPRYSGRVNWKVTQMGGVGETSKPVNWRGTPSLGAPRYSRPVNWKGAYMLGKPRYSSYKHRFVVNKRYMRETRPYDPWVGKYHGMVKYKKPNHKNMHPSVNYLVAKNIPIKLVRKGLRSWNGFWVRINDSKLTPKGTRKFAKKPKFDKKERDIWNNDREDKPTTRQDTTAQAEIEIPEAEKEEGNQ